MRTKVNINNVRSVMSKLWISFVLPQYLYIYVSFQYKIYNNLHQLAIRTTIFWIFQAVNLPFSLNHYKYRNGKTIFTYFLFRVQIFYFYFQTVYRGKKQSVFVLYHTRFKVLQRNAMITVGKKHYPTVTTKILYFKI